MKTRRKRYDIIQTFKILKGSNRKVWFKKTCDTSVRNTSQSDDPTRLTKQRTNTNIGSNFFSQNVIDDWNQVPNIIRESLNLKTFKLKLDQYCHPLNRNQDTDEVGYPEDDLRS